MHVHCLGTTGYHPSPTRHTACYYVPELGLVFDAGTGLFRLVQRLLEQPRQNLDIVLSHAHLDHVVGLTFLLDVLAVTQVKHIRVIGEAVKLAAIREHLYSADLFPVDPPMEFVPLPAASGTMQLHSPATATATATTAELHYFPLEHPGGSVGYVLEFAGQRIAYLTDTIARPDASYLSHIQAVDLLLHECYFGDEHQALALKTGHSWLAAVTQVVRSTQPARTALIHLNPLAEILGNGFTLSSAHRELGIFIPNDEQVLAVTRA